MHDALHATSHVTSTSKGLMLNFGRNIERMIIIVILDPICTTIILIKLKVQHSPNIFTIFSIKFDLEQLVGTFFIDFSFIVVC